jgi:uncharacterized protein (TIGR03435 family)
MCRATLPFNFLAIAFLANSFSRAQPTSGPTFDVASVKPSSANENSRASAKGDRVYYNKVSLKTLLGLAYSLKDYQIDGPGWIATRAYDVLANAPDNTPKDQISVMLQNLLIERFQLKLHRETRELSVCELTVGKNPKLKENPQRYNGFVDAKGHREARGMEMSLLATFLTRWLGSPVLDKTGLSGYYDFPLEPSLEERPRAETLPSVFWVMQQIGLKLESRKEPIEMIVVDGGNPMPSEN